MLTTLYTFIQIRIILYTHYKYIQCFKHFLFYNYIDSTKDGDFHALAKF